MFSFMTKKAGGAVAFETSDDRDADKERRKKDKKDRKDRDKKRDRASTNSGSEEPLRLDEVRRSLKLRRRKEKEKLPSGITADYTASFFAQLELDRNYSNYPLVTNSGSNSNLSDETTQNQTSPVYNSSHANWSSRRVGDRILQSDSSETSLNSLNNPNANSSPRQPPDLPPLPPRPPKRGILKGPRLSSTSSHDSSGQGFDTNDFQNGQENVVLRNTMQNEMIVHQNQPVGKSVSSNDDLLTLQNFTKKVLHSPVDGKGYYTGYKTPAVNVSEYDDQRLNGSHNLGGPSASPSVDSLTDTTTNSSFATPPFSLSPVGESQGFQRWSKISSFEDINLPLPNITPMPLPKARILTIPRQKSPRNDFGFSLRRAYIIERLFVNGAKENGHSSTDDNGFSDSDSVKGVKVNGCKSSVVMKPVIFAEPGAIMQNYNETGLLPGDRLLEVNGVSVDDKCREEIIDMIKSSEDCVVVKVQPVAELSELSRRRAVDGQAVVELDDSNIRGGTLRRSGSRRFGKQGARSEEQLAKEKEWLDAELMWLSHRGGFTAVRRLASERGFDDGKVRVRIQQTGDVVTVDEDDLEKANPAQFERAEDIAGLRCLNESSALDVLRARLAAGLPHTYSGDTLIVINPRTHLPIYSDKIAALFKGCKQEDMPPHVYASAQSAYRSMLTSRRDRAIVLLGRSGSGKTTVLKHSLQYLAVAAGTAGGYLTVEKLGAVHTVLEAFGNCRTGANSNATRFVSLFSLDFDQAGLIASASVQTLLLEKTLAGRRPTTESTFHVIYRLFCGCDNRLRRDLFLDAVDQQAFNPFLTIPESLEERQNALTAFSQLRSSLSAIGVSEEEQKVIWNVLAAIIHLGWAGVSKANSGGTLKYQFASPVAANRAAQLLGCSPEELARIIFSSVSGGLSPTANGQKNSYRSPSPTGSIGSGLGGDRDITASEALEGLVVGLYAEVFNCVAALINRCLMTPARTTVSLLILDTPGADNPLGRGEQGGAPLPRLTHNYLQERLQAALHDALLVAPREKYSQEGIVLADLEDHDWVSEAISPVHMVELLDKAPQNAIVHSSQADLRDCDRRGILWLLDEESMYPGSSDESFLERVFLHYGSSSSSSNATNGNTSNGPTPGPKYHHLVKRAPHANQFIIQHFQGTNPVLYNVSGWLKSSRENPIIKKAIGLLQESTNETLSRLVVWSRGAGSGLMQTATPDVQSAATLRRASSIRRTLTQGTAGMKRGSVALHARFASDALLDSLRRCGSPGGIRFICCMLAQHANLNSGGETVIEDVNVPLLRSQFRGFQLLDVARLYKQGFPEYMPLGEFARRFRILAFPHGDTDSSRDASSPTITDMIQRDRQLVEDMLLALDLDATTYRVGMTQILFRGGALPALEAARDALLVARVARLQACCRGVLARRRAARLRVLHTAARCVQRNVRAFLAVRDWPWWRLLVRVHPLLEVNRTEDRLRMTTEELEGLRLKVEKLETERSQLKHENGKLEAKLSETGAELAEERGAAALATQRLDAETSERLRLERDLRDLHSKNDKLQQTSERLELEVLHARGESAASVASDNESGAGDDGDAADRYRRRYERASRELNAARAQLRRQHEDDLEQIVAVKKQLEKKLADAYEEVDEQRQVAAGWKRKLQKLTNDMADLRSLLDEQTCRNNLLEKRQRKFDAELHSVQDELKRERSAKERTSRERDLAQAEKYALEQNLTDARMEVELKDEKIQSLQKELDEVGGGNGGDSELALLKKLKSDLEKKCHDQEEELDEMAGQVQLLESSKLRLEMMLEQQRKESRIEAQQRDEELDEARSQAIKKVKALESQLETEHGERTLLLRERHELERRLASLEEQARSENSEMEQQLQRLRRDVKRYRALLRDAQAMIEQKDSDAGTRAQIRDLKAQLEEAEVAVRAAQRARAAAEQEACEASAAANEAQAARREADQRATTALRDAAHTKSLLDDADEEAQELMKKYRACATSLSSEQASARALEAAREATEDEARSLRERLADAQQRLTQLEAGQEQDAAEHNKLLELKTKELESKLELEQTTRTRLEGQISRLKDSIEKVNSEVSSTRQKEQLAQDELRKLQRQMKEMREEVLSLSSRLEEATRARAAAETRASAAATEAASARRDARTAQRRAADLQAALAADLSPNTDNSHEDSENDSYSSDESIETFLANHKLSPSTPSKHNFQSDNSRSTESRQSRSSAGSTKTSSPVKESFA